MVDFNPYSPVAKYLWCTREMVEEAHRWAGLPWSKDGEEIADLGNSVSFMYTWEDFWKRADELVMSLGSCFLWKVYYAAPLRTAAGICILSPECVAEFDNCYKIKFNESGFPGARGETVVSYLKSRIIAVRLNVDIPMLVEAKESCG